MKNARARSPMLRHEQVFDQPHTDSYRADAKLADPARCPTCNAAYRNGRWTWQDAGADAVAHQCPACLRIHDHFPAGYLSLKGKFTPERREELLSLVRAREAHAKAEHPMQRIMAIEDVTGGILVTTTDGHLARGIGHALRDAFRGTLEINFAHDENLVRATWRSER